MKNKIGMYITLVVFGSCIGALIGDVFYKRRLDLEYDELEEEILEKGEETMKNVEADSGLTVEDREKLLVLTDQYDISATHILMVNNSLITVAQLEKYYFDMESERIAESDFEDGYTHEPIVNYAKQYQSERKPILINNEDGIEDFIISVIEPTEKWARKEYICFGIDDGNWFRQIRSNRFIPLDNISNPLTEAEKEAAIQFLTEPFEDDGLPINRVYIYNVNRSNGESEDVLKPLYVVSSVYSEDLFGEFGVAEKIKSKEVNEDG